MAIDDATKQKLASELARRIFRQANVTGHSDGDELIAAIGKIDAAMDATGSQIVTAGYGATALKVAMLTELKTAAPNLTNAEAGVALALWALNEVDLI